MNHLKKDFTLYSEIYHKLPAKIGWDFKGSMEILRIEIHFWSIISLRPGRSICFFVRFLTGELIIEKNSDDHGNSTDNQNDQYPDSECFTAHATQICLADKVACNGSCPQTQCVYPY